MSFYSREFAGLAKEVKRGVGGTVSLWPKLFAANVLVTSAVASRGAATITNVGSPAAYSRIDVALSAADAVDYTTETAPLLLAVTWAGTGVSGVDVVTYDVVHSPLGLLVSANQLREARPSLQAVLVRLGVLLAETGATALTPEQVAAVYAAKARVELQDKLRQAARERELQRASVILDRDRLLRAETALAIAHCYQAVAKDPTNGKDVDSAQALFWRGEWAAAWAELGPLTVDVDQDGVPDETPVAPSIGLIFTRRG